MRIEVSEANAKELLELRDLMSLIEENAEVTINEALGISVALAKLKMLEILAEKRAKAKERK